MVKKIKDKKWKMLSEFPEQVLSVKQYLMESEDPRAETMRMLTEPKDTAYLSDFHKMWNVLFEKAQKGGGVHDDLWVYLFLESVIAAADQPPYFQMNGQDRRDLLDSIKNDADALINRLTHYQLDAHFIASTAKTFSGFVIYEDLSESNMARIGARAQSKLSFVNALKGIKDYVFEEIAAVNGKSKATPAIKPNRFLRRLATSNKRVYGKPLNSVLQTAVLAVYGIDYKISRISNLIMDL